MLLFTSLLLPHMYCNVEYELIQLILQRWSETLILKREMLLEFQNKINFEIIGF